MHLQKIQWAPIGEKTQERKRFRFVKKKSVVLACEQIDRENNNEIQFRPGKCADDCDRPRPESVDQHQKDDADNDAGMSDKKTD